MALLEFWEGQNAFYWLAEPGGAVALAVGAAQTAARIAQSLGAAAD